MTQSDNCAGSSQALTSGLAPNAAFPVGSTRVNYTATDAVGRTASCSFDVNVVDQQPPLLTCPTNQNLVTRPGVCNAIANTYSPSTASLLGALSLTKVREGTDDDAFVQCALPFPFYMFGTNWQNLVFVGSNSYVTFGFNSTAFSSLSASRPGRGLYIKAADNSYQRVYCGAESPNRFRIRYEGTAALSGTVGASTMFWELTFYASNQMMLVTGDLAERSPALVGLSDGSSFVTQPPVTAHSSFVIETSDVGNTWSHRAGSYVDLAAATDNCGVTSLSSLSGTLLSGSQFELGSTNVVHVASDSQGNVGNCTFTVTVTDNQSPTITCPANIATPTDSGVCGAVANFSGATTTDNCGSTAGQTSGMVSGSTFPVGTSSVVFTATDGINTNTCTMTVSITDATPPVIVCPSDITSNRDAGKCNATVSFTPPVGTDACNVTTSLTQGLPPGSVFPLGDTLVVYTAVDASGNQASCQLTVRVLDNDNPQITCPGDIQANNTPGQCGTNVTYASPATSDCIVSTLGSVQAIGSGNVFSVGTHTETYNVTNVAGVSSMCSFVVAIADVELPQITCPTVAGVIGTDSGVCNATLTYTAPVGVDNCGNSVTVQTAGAGPGGVVSANYSSREAFVVTDASGLQASCDFTVMVIDDEAPMISCNADIFTGTDSGLCTAAVSYSAVVTSDNCAVRNVVQTMGLGSGSNFPVGVTRIEYYVYDWAGNNASCTFTVNVSDTEHPVLTCPASVNFSAAAGRCDQTISYTVTHSDNCAGSSQQLVSGPASGSVVTVGSSTAVFNALDAAGNMAMCQFAVNVVDNESPLITCPSIAAQSNDAGMCNAVVTYSAATTSDNCPGQTTAQTSVKGSGSTFDVGSTTVSYTVTDASGHQASCIASVVVNDDEDPIISKTIHIYTFFLLSL